MGKGRKAAKGRSPTPSSRPTAAAEEAAALQAKWKEDAAAKQKKADEAAAQRALENARREAWEKEQLKQARDKEREEKLWQKQLEAIRARALAEGVLRAEDWGDGVWWVRMGELWKEVQGEFFCSLCDKHLNDATLQAHVESDLHKKRLAWRQPAANSAGPASKAAPVAAPATAPAAVPPKASPPSPGQAPAAAAPLEDWQEMGQDGFLRCAPCGKVIDELHLAKADHASRLERWRHCQAARSSGHAPPELPYLAWVPWEGEGGHRCLKCLLCDKWVQDDWSHSGSQKAPNGSKEHLKNLRNYGPGDYWWEEKVVKERRRWHPEEAAAPRPRPPASTQPSEPSVRLVQPAATGLPTKAKAAPWAQAPLPKASPAGPQEPAQAAAPPEAAAYGGPPLQPGWEAGKCDDGQGTSRTYFYNRTLGLSSWEVPLATAAAPVAAAVPPPPPQQPPAAAARPLARGIVEEC